jgi:hypothetical protein
MISKIKHGIHHFHANGDDSISSGMRYSSNQTVTAVLLAFGLWPLVSGLSGKAGLVHHPSLKMKKFPQLKLLLFSNKLY